MVVRQAPPDSALNRPTTAAEWAAVEHPELTLLQSVEYSLRWLVWAKTDAAQHRRGRPEPIRFPWQDTPADSEFGRPDGMTIAEANRMLGWTDRDDRGRRINGTGR